MRSQTEDEWESIPTGKVIQESNMRSRYWYVRLRHCVGSLASMRLGVDLKICCAVILLFIQAAYSQTFRVHGNVSTCTIPVRYASVTFIDQSDTSKKYSAITDTSGNYQIDILTSAEVKPTIQPTNIELAQNYPNPFSSSTAISYQLNKQSDVNVTIYDILGREIRKYTVGFQTAGVHGVMWDGKNNFGGQVATGVYFYRLRTQKETQVKKMIFVGGNTIISVPLIGNYSAEIKDLKKVNALYATGRTFAVRLTNTDSTTPRILEIMQNNIEISSDTTLDYLLQETLSKDAHITDIAFADSLYGWLVTDFPGKQIFKTEDGGYTWILQKDSIIAYQLNKIRVVDERFLWVIGNSGQLSDDTTNIGIVIHSTDAGVTWNYQYIRTTNRLNDIFFLNAQEGWIVGGKPLISCSQGINEIFHTTDGGNHWATVYSGLEGVLSGVFFVGSNGWAVGGPALDNFCDKVILRTQNNGSTWTGSRPATLLPGRLKSVKFLDSLVGYAAGGVNVLKTINGGNDWMPVYQGTGIISDPMPFDVSVLSDSLVISLSVQHILKSVDGGNTWTVEWQPSDIQNQFLHCFFFLNDSTGWASGTNATVVKYSSGTWRLLPFK
jgi:photosystem II stability/assembly factor-like uncharacterized protein/flagellar hook assembly protein FlgD